MSAAPQLIVRSVLWACTLLPFFTCCLYAFYRPIRNCGQIHIFVLFIILALSFLVPVFWPNVDRRQSIHLLIGLIAISFLYIPAISWLSRFSLRFVLYCIFFGINASTALGLPLLVIKYSGYSVSLPTLLATHIIISVLLCWLCIRLLRIHVLPYREYLTALGMRYYDIAPALYLALMLLFYANYNENPVTLQIVICALGLCGTYSAYFLSGKLFFQRLDSMQFQQRSMYLEHCIQLQQSQYETLGEQIRLAHAARHDLRQQLHALEQYLLDGNRDRLYEYLPFLRKQIALLQNEPSICSNSAVDAIARHYLRQAQQAGVLLDIRFDVEENFAIPGFDLCIVIGNYLENAVEALRSVELEKRFIRLRAEQVNDMFTLVAANSYYGGRMQQNNIFLSTKRPGQEGIGLSSIKSIVQKYAGTCEMDATDGIFKISLILFAKREQNP